MKPNKSKKGRRPCLTGSGHAKGIGLAKAPLADHRLGNGALVYETYTQNLDLDLYDLRTRLRQMEDLVIAQIETALDCLSERDVRLTRAIIEQDLNVNHMDIDIEEICFRFLALHQPTRTLTDPAYISPFGPAPGSTDRFVGSPDCLGADHKRLRPEPNDLKKGKSFRHN